MRNDPTRRFALAGLFAAFILVALLAAATTLPGSPAREARAHAAPQALIELSGTIKPGASVFVSADCPEGDASADVVTSTGASVKLYPAADSGQLIGDFSLPSSIEAGPDEGYHTATVTCASGAKATVRLTEDGNGSARTQWLLEQSGQ